MYQLMLALIAVTYRVSLMHFLPATACVTVLDKQQQACFIIVIATTFETAALAAGPLDCSAHSATSGCLDDAAVQIADRACQAAAAAVWVAAHGWFARVAWVEYYAQFWYGVPRVEAMQADAQRHIARQHEPAAARGTASSAAGLSALMC